MHVPPEQGWRSEQEKLSQSSAKISADLAQTRQALTAAHDQYMAQNAQRCRRAARNSDPVGRLASACAIVLESNLQSFIV